MTDDLGRHLRRVAEYQFGAGAGQGLFPDVDTLTVHRTSSGRPRQVLQDGKRLVTYAEDGRFTLGLQGGRRLQSALEAPRARVVVGDESEPYVREGRNAFAKFVDVADEGIRPRDEVLVVHEDGTLLAVGRATLPGPAMRDFASGVAVEVRDAAGPAADGGSGAD